MADVEEALRDVVDPELGINVVDLGLVYGVAVDPEPRHHRHDPDVRGVPAHRRHRGPDRRSPRRAASSSGSTGCGCRRGAPTRSPTTAASSCAPSASTSEHSSDPRRVESPRPGAGPGWSAGSRASSVRHGEPEIAAAPDAVQLVGSPTARPALLVAPFRALGGRRLGSLVRGWSRRWPSTPPFPAGWACWSSAGAALGGGLWSDGTEVVCLEGGDAGTCRAGTADGGLVAAAVRAPPGESRPPSSRTPPRRWRPGSSPSPGSTAVTGGDRALVDAVLAEPALRRVGALPRGPHLAVGDPDAALVRGLPVTVTRVRVTLREER